MLRRKPTLQYRGLTVILSNPSRFDKVALLTATGGQLFNDYCLRPEMNLMQCDVRLAEDSSPFLSGTLCVLLCGEFAMHKWLPETIKNTIGEMRGSPFFRNGVYMIPSFSPQDCADMRTYEQQLNPLSKDYTPDANEYESDDDDEGDVKKHGKTARRNFAWWLKQDVRKCKTIIACGGKLPVSEFPEPHYEIFPNSERVIRLLEDTRGCTLYLDIETDYEQCNLQCFAFSFDGCTITSVPVLDYNYRPAYTNYPRIIRALASAMDSNTVVAHNGAAFDFFVLGYKYRIAINKTYDTMLAQHRCFPDIEKSLGHCTSLWTWEKFHKDEDSQGYNIAAQMDARLRYCAKDVRTMFLIHKAIEKYACTIPGLTHSIQTAMDSIKPYLITSIQGIKYNETKVEEIKKENDELMMQYARMICLLIGEQGMAAVRASIKGKPSLFPGSNAQCIAYFHDLLGYPVVARSKKTQKPSLGKLALYKLALKHGDNPVITLTLMYRKIAKEYGTLKFMPWKDNEGNIYDPTTIDRGIEGHVPDKAVMCMD